MAEALTLPGACLAFGSGPILGLGMAVVVIIALCLLLSKERRQHREALRKWQRSAAAEKSNERQLLLVSHEMRALALDVRGSADRLKTDAHPVGPRLEHMSNAMFEVADNVHEWTIHAEPVLREEALGLGNMLDEATSALIGALGAGKREWRTDPRFKKIFLRADRRALRHVMTRALTACVRGSCQHDPIIAALREDGDQVRMVIQSGDHQVPVADTEPGTPARMALAQRLMDALGGSIEVACRDLDGVTVYTRVTIGFPASRMLDEGDAALNAPPVLVPARTADHDSRRKQAALT